MAKLTTYDAQTARTIAQFVRDQKRQAPRRLNNDLSINRNPRVIRWAKATTNAKYPTYPTSGTVFIAQLGDYEISETATVEPGESIAREFTEYGTSDSDYAIVVCDGAPLPIEDAIIRIELHDSQWIYTGDSRTIAIYGSQSTAPPGPAVYENGTCLAPNSRASLVFPSLFLLHDMPAYDGDGTLIRDITDYAESLCDSQTDYDDPAIQFNTPFNWLLFLTFHLEYYGDWFGGATPYIQTYTTSSDGTPAHTHTVDARSTDDFGLNIETTVYARKASAAGWTSQSGFTSSMYWHNTVVADSLLMSGIAGLSYQKAGGSGDPGNATLADPLQIRIELSAERMDSGTYPVNDKGAVVSDASIVAQRFGSYYWDDWH